MDSRQTRRLCALRLLAVRRRLRSRAPDLVLHELYRRLLGTRDAVAAGRLPRPVEDAGAASLDVVDLVGVGDAVGAAVRVDHAREEDARYRS